MNRFAYYSRDTKQTVEYVKSILPFISDIREFELYKVKESPFVEVIQDCIPTRRSVFYNQNDYKSMATTTSLGQQIKGIQVYTFVLRDDFYNEIWLYADPKKIETSEILHMLGLKDITNFQNKSGFIGRHLKPKHDLNVLVEDDKENRILLAKYTFPYACKRMRAVEIMNTYGLLNPIMTKGDYGDNFCYFESTPIRNNETFDFATNNIFLLDEENVTYDYAVDIIDFIANETGGNVKIIPITS